MICNGDLWSYSDIKNIRNSILNSVCPLNVDKTRLSGLSYMVSRPALWNPAVFAEIKRNRSLEEQNPLSDIGSSESPIDSVLAEIVV